MSIYGTLYVLVSQRRFSKFLTGESFLSKVRIILARGMLDATHHPPCCAICQNVVKNILCLKPVNHKCLWYWLFISMMHHLLFLWLAMIMLRILCRFDQDFSCSDLTKIFLVQIWPRSASDLTKINCADLNKISFRRSFVQAAPTYPDKQ